MHGRLAQLVQSAWFTPRRSQVRILYRPLGSTRLFRFVLLLVIGRSLHIVYVRTVVAVGSHTGFRRPPYPPPEIFPIPFHRSTLFTSLEERF